MKKFIKTFVVFVYLILAFFIQPSDSFACNYNELNHSEQYYITATKSKTHFLNNKEEEYYVISKNNTQTEKKIIENTTQMPLAQGFGLQLFS